MSTDDHSGFAAPGPPRPEPAGVPDGHVGWQSGSGPQGPAGPGGPVRAGWPAAPPIHRPGAVPLRPLTLADIWGGVLRTIRANVQATVGAGLLVSVVVLALLTPLALLLTDRGLTGAPSAPSAPDVGAALSTSLGQNVPTLASVFTPALLATFLAYVVSRAVLGQRVDLRRTWQATRSRVLPVVGNVLLVWLISFTAVAVILVGPAAFLVSAIRSQSGDRIGPAVLLLVVAILLLAVLQLYLWTRWAFTVPAIVLERYGPLTGFGRSWQLTAGRGFWRVLGIRLLTSLVVSAAAYVIVLPISVIVAGVLAAGGLDVRQAAWLGIAVNAFAVLVSGALTTPFTSGVDAMLYVDQRIRREGLDVTLIQATSAGPDAAGALRMTPQGASGPPPAGGAWGS